MSRIRSDHLLHLLGTIQLPAQEREELEAGLRENRVIARQNALNAIEAQRPGTLARLRALWTVYSRQSLFLWHATALAKYGDFDGVSSALKDAAAATLQCSADEIDLRSWVTLSAPPAIHAEVESDDEESVDEDPGTTEPRMLRVRTVGQVIEATVRLTRYTHFVYEDEEQKQAITQDINLTIDMSDDRRRLTRVFGGQQNAKKAVRTFLEWVGRARLPARNPALARHMEPFRFTEDDVLALAERLDLELVGMQGADARNALGGVTYEGKLDGFRLAPLDANDDRVKSQEEIPQDVRVYNWEVEHEADGFVEAGRVAFVMEGSHSHISFPVRMSRASMDTVVAELWASLVE